MSWPLKIKSISSPFVVVLNQYKIQAGKFLMYVLNSEISTDYTDGILHCLKEFLIVVLQ